jgi:hypothetical protein
VVFGVWTGAGVRGRGMSSVTGGTLPSPMDVPQAASTGIAAGAV